MSTEKRSVPRIVAMLIVAALMTAVVVPVMESSSGTTRLSNGEYDEDKGMWIDGLAGDEHNSYAWCTEVFDGYLWVGTNRDLIGSILWSFNASTKNSDSPMWDLLNGLGIPFPSLPDSANPEEPYDATGKIYRYNMDPARGPSTWELVWGGEDDEGAAEFSGYRKMLIFNGELYVFAGLTNLVIGAQEGKSYVHSVVYRFGEGFQIGDKPEIVLWDYLPGILDDRTKQMEFYRAATVGMVDGKEWLFVGTIDGRIFATDGSKLTALELPALGVLPDYESSGWVNMGIDEKFGLASNGDNRIWDLITFNDHLYAFVSGMYDGFMVFEIELEIGANWVPIVATTTDDISGAAYPSGVGIQKHVTASPFVMTVDGKEWVYVTTFANGPMFLIGMALEMVKSMAPGMTESDFGTVFEDMYCPATIYRFGTDGVWEVVVGEYNDAMDSRGVPLRNVGNSRAGFFTGLGPNSSSNQYIWWMEQHEGVIYAGTWDMGFFRTAMQLMTAKMFLDSFDGAGAEFVGAAQNLFAALVYFISEVRDIDFTELQTDIADILNNAIDDIRRAIPSLIAGANAEDIGNQILADLEADLLDELKDTFGASVDSAEALITSIETFFKVADLTNAATREAIMEVMDFLFEKEMLFGLYTLDFKNPPGFDLYYSENGVDFYPYTVNGFGNQYNYGARILKSTELGMLVFTANPFGGCSVWVLDDPMAEITGLPESISVEIGGTAKFRIESTGLLLSDTMSVKLGDGTVVNATIEMMDEKSERVDYWSTVERMLTMYVEKTHNIDGEYFIPKYVYEVTLTGLNEYSGPIDVVLNIGGEQFRESMNLDVSEATAGRGETSGNGGGDTNWTAIGAGAAVGVVGIVGLLYFFVWKP